MCGELVERLFDTLGGAVQWHDVSVHQEQHYHAWDQEQEQDAQHKVHGKHRAVRHCCCCRGCLEELEDYHMAASVHAAGLRGRHCG